MVSIVVIPIAVLIVLILASIGIWFFKFKKTKNFELNVANPISKNDHDNPEQPLSQLRTVKESEIRILNILGQGAFGTVYEARWTPDAQTNSIPVAVKVLHQNNSPKSVKAFLDEAVIMTQIDHTNIVHLIAICITTEIMLITNLMPLGCILNYVRINKERISPKALLTWSMQIAKGMAYLETKHLVHRDLAARNVLLESVDCAKIADFGLSKFVGHNISGNNDTKFPSKWLAPESLEERVFTHKSDVWAFGVTIWELLTFGERPFDKIKGRDLPKQLKLGLKLVQPSTCNADVYAILIRCWLLNPDLRPGFIELEDTFRKMSYEASKYLVSYGTKYFKILNYPRQETARISRGSTYQNNDARAYEVHYRSASHTENSYEEVQELLDFAPYNRSGYLEPNIENEGYLEPNIEIMGSDSGYDAVTNYQHN